MANKQETNWIARIISAIIFAIAVYLIFRPICYLFKSWKIQKKNKKTTQNLHHNLGDFWLTEQEKQQFLFYTSQKELAKQKIEQLSKYNPPTRKDGKYDERNRDGKEANYYTEQKYKSEKITEQLSLSPLKKWNQFNDSLKEEYSLRTANFLLWVYIPCLIILQSNYADGTSVFLLSMIFLGLLQLVTYKITLSLVKNPALQFTPKPERITLDNLNEHTYGEESPQAGTQDDLPDKQLQMNGGYIFGCIAIIICLPLVFFTFNGKDKGSPQQITALQKRQTNLEMGILQDIQELEKERKTIIKKREHLLTEISLKPVSHINEL